MKKNSGRLNSEIVGVEVAPVGADGSTSLRGQNDGLHGNASMRGVIGSAKRKPVSLSWQDLTVDVDIQVGKNEKKTRHILKSISGDAEPGSLLAILGSSGAGKTTLLNVIAQRAGDGDDGLSVGGKVLFNGRPVTSRIIRKHSVYIQQQDILLPTLTPRESLKFSADMRLPASMPDQEKMARVDALVRELGLEECADSMVGDHTMRGLSGGEKKRCSIGVELITDPSVLFVDEPTSGLDAYTAQSVVEMLKDMADAGRTIVCTIHQPSSNIFLMFDRLMLLAAGHIVYLGPASKAVEHFAKLGYECPAYTNPADYFMRILNEECKDERKLAEIVAHYNEEAAAERAEKAQESDEQPPEEGEDESEEANRRGVHPSFISTMLLLSYRALLNYMRQPFLLRTRFFQNIFLGLLAGLLYLGLGKGQDSVQDRNGALFFINISQGITSILSVVLTFPAERALFLREKGNGMYSAGPYFMSKLVSELPFQILFPTIFCSIAYYLIGFQDETDKFLIFLAVNILLVNTGQSLGLVIGAWAPTAEIGMQITPIAMIPFIVFAGLFAQTDNIPVYFKWIEWLSPFRWAYEVLMANEYQGLDLTCTGAGSIPVCFRKGEQVLYLYGFDHDNIPLAFLILSSLFVGYRIIAFLVLSRQRLKKS